MRSRWVLTAAGAALIAAAITATRAQTPSQPYPGLLEDHPAIQYAARPTTDRASALNRELATGSQSLTYRGPNGYLESVLDALHVSSETQILVFSKTGIQGGLTGPTNPRALYFNDTTVVGYISGAPIIEIAAHDPTQGVLFYTLPQTVAVAPTLNRQALCVRCHVSRVTLEVPGLINRSVFTSRTGQTIPQLGFHDVDHRTPLLERWGGMYVTGKYLVTPYAGRKVHMGNVTVASHTEAATTSNEGMMEWLASDANARGYLSKESDIATMMVFDHQARATNLLTRLNWETRIGGDWQAIADELVDYFLFVGETPPPTRLSPREGFLTAFMANARKDAQGRSLRQLDLATRLLRYPLSYMIYAEAFDHLPAPAKSTVYQRLATILSGRDHSPKYAQLSTSIRRAIVEILRATKKDLPDSFQEATLR